MKKNTYIGAIGIASYIFATIQTVIIICYPMITYVFTNTDDRPYTAAMFRRHIPNEAYIFAAILFAVAILAFIMVCKAGEKRDS